MSSIDKRVVELYFKNGQFQSGAKQSIETLGLLKKALLFNSSTNPFEKIDKAAKNLRLKGLGEDVGLIASRFTTLGIIGTTVLQNLTNSVVNFSKSLVRHMLDPLVQGGIRRAENIEQAHFQLEGLLGKMDSTWNGFKADILYGVKDTAYGFDEAARVASQLAASGYRAGDGMKAYLRGISGVAAMTNSSYSDIGNIFTTVAGNGRLMGEQLLQLSSRGLNAAAALVKYFKDVRGEANITEADIRDMVSHGKLDFETFALAMDYAFGEHATAANKTFRGALANVRAAFSRIGADIASQQLINLRDIFNALRPVIDRVHELLMPLIAIINRLSITTTNFIVSGLEKLFKKSADGSKVFGVLSDSTLKTSEAFKNIQDTFRGLISFINILFTIFKKLLYVLLPITKALGSMIEVILSVTGAIGRFLVILDDALQKSTAFKTFINGLRSLFSGIANIFVLFFNAIANFIKGVEDAKDTPKKIDPIGKVFQTLGDKLDILGKKLNSVKNFFSKLIGYFIELGATFSKSFSAAGSGKRLESMFKLFTGGIILAIVKNINAITMAFGRLGVQISDLFTYGTKNARGSFNIVKAFKKAFGDGEIFNMYLEPLQNMRAVLIAYQRDLNASALLKIAKAIALLAASIFILSTIRVDRLATALGGLAGIMFLMTRMFSELMVTLDGFSMVSALKTGLAVFYLQGLAVALLILAGAVKMLSTLNLMELAKGLIGVAVLMEILVRATQSLAADKSIIAGAGRILVLAIALTVLTRAVKNLSQIKASSLVKALGAIEILFLELYKFIDLLQAASVKNAGFKMNSVAILTLSTSIIILTKALHNLAMIKATSLVKSLGALGVVFKELSLFIGGISDVRGSLLRAAIAIGILSAGMIVLSHALIMLSRIDLKNMAVALGGIGAALIEFVLALRGISNIPNIKAGAASLFVLAITIKILATAITAISKLDLQQIGTALLGIGGALFVLVIALNSLSGATGAFTAAGSLFLLSLAISALVPPLVILGNMSLWTIAKGLIALGGALGILVLASSALAGAIGPVLAFSVAVALIGLGIGAAAAGIGLLITAITALGAALAAGTFSISELVKNLAILIPEILKSVAEGIIGFIEAFASGFKSIAPKIVEMLLTMLETTAEYLPKFIKTGAELIVGFLTGMAEKLPEIITAAVKFITAFIDGVAANIAAIIDSGFNLMIAFIDGLTKAIKNRGPELAVSIQNLIQTTILTAINSLIAMIPGFFEFGKQLVTSIGNGITLFGSAIWNSITTALNSAYNAIINFASSFYSGAANLGRNFISGIRSILSAAVSVGRNLVSAVKTAISNGVHGIYNIGVNFVQGFIDGIKSKIKSAVEAVANLGTKAKNKLKDILKIFSPSRVTKELGEFFTIGFANGIYSSIHHATRAAAQLSNKTVGLLDTRGADMDVGDPVIRPVLDLDELKSGLKEMNTLMQGKTLDLSTTANLAASANPEYPKWESPVESKTATNIVFEQNNYSPRALSRLEIYRQTRNQLSQVKEILGQ